MSDTWTQSQSTAMDGSLQAAFQRHLDPESLGNDSRCSHNNQKLIVVNIRRNNKREMGYKRKKE